MKKLCPRCELNYIDAHEQFCSVCVPKPIDYTILVTGKYYGTNSQEIYINCCTALNWDLSKKNQFGRWTPCLAHDADAERKRDVWFIYHSKEQ